MKISTFLVGTVLFFGLLFNGCGGEDGGGGDSTVSAPVTVLINGAVNDAPVAFAKVRLVLHPSDEEIATLTADANGKWNYTVDKASIPADTFIMIYAKNPDNNSTIRSIIDTDEVLESDGVFETDETTVSHYTEAAIVLAEADGDFDQTKFDEIKSLIVLENGEPTTTGNTELDKLAEVIQTNFDDENSSQDKLHLSVYEALLTNTISSVLADEFGEVAINLPTSYNEEITINATTSTGTQLDVVDDSITFTLTPQEIQTDVNLTITATLNEETLTKNITFYAKGNSEDHYTHQAVAPSSEPLASTTTVMINGRNYTLIPYSFTAIEQSDANTDAITIDGTLRDRSFTTLKIADNYANTKTLVKVYEGKENFDFVTLVGDSGITALASNQVNIGNIEVTRVDDFRPLSPTDTNIEMPPVAPEF